LIGLVLAPQKSGNEAGRTTKEVLNVLAYLLAAVDDGVDAGKAIALALGIGLGSLGAGIGIGNIFGSMIQAVARQPELRGELQGIQWLGFALTEAVVFYGLIGGLLAYVLI
jgi:F-type H+-transporting ATPase subunit c